MTLANAAATLAAAATTLATAATALFSSDAAWALNDNGTKRTPSARSVAKHRQVMPAVDSILSAGNAIQQGALLRAITDHPLMASARKMAHIKSSKEAAATEFIAEQSARMMERNRSKLRGNSTAEKRHAVEVVLSFCAPSPQKTTVVPSRRERARVLALARVDACLIEKRRQLTNGETGLYWALSKRKKGYSKIDEELWLLLVDAFNNHPHVIVSPNYDWRGDDGGGRALL